MSGKLRGYKWWQVQPNPELQITLSRMTLPISVSTSVPTSFLWQVLPCSGHHASNLFPTAQQFRCYQPVFSLTCLGTRAHSRSHYCEQAMYRTFLSGHPGSRKVGVNLSNLHTQTVQMWWLPKGVKNQDCERKKKEIYPGQERTTDFILFFYEGRQDGYRTKSIFSFLSHISVH